MEIKKRILALLLPVTLSIVAGAQGTIVTGIILDNRQVPIVGATVCQVNTLNCTAADMNGTFNLQLDADKDMSLQVKCLGFNPVEVVIDESTPLPLTINLSPMYIPDDLFFEENITKNSIESFMRSSLSLSVVFSDFAEFTSELGAYNTDLMDYFSVIGPELGASVSRIYFGFGLGMGYNYKDDHDTLVIDLKNTSYRLILGYDLVSTRRLRVTPHLSARWLRYRLMNYPAERKISLTNYLSERDIDIRFNQAIAVAGLNIEFIMDSSAPGRGDYWSIGAEGGYAVKLNRTPWVYSKGNRLMTDREIGLNHLAVGLGISYYTIFR